MEGALRTVGHSHRLSRSVPSLKPTILQFDYLQYWHCVEAIFIQVSALSEAHNLSIWLPAILTLCWSNFYPGKCPLWSPQSFNGYLQFWHSVDDVHHFFTRSQVHSMSLHHSSYKESWVIEHLVLVPQGAPYSPQRFVEDLLTTGQI